MSQQPDWEAELRALLTTEREAARTQISSLDADFATIVDASREVATDDEHDPEGATIAYERAQALALLRQAREDLVRLSVARATIDAGQRLVCAVCGEEIDAERISGLPTADRCIRCAR